MTWRSKVIAERLLLIFVLLISSVIVFACNDDSDCCKSEYGSLCGRTNLDGKEIIVSSMAWTEKEKCSSDRKMVLRNIIQYECNQKECERMDGDYEIWDVCESNEECKEGDASLVECVPKSGGCPNNQFLCPDGHCEVNMNNCCPPGQIQCSDGQTCKATQSECDSLFNKDGVLINLPKGEIRDEKSNSLVIPALIISLAIIIGATIIAFIMRKK